MRKAEEIRSEIRKIREISTLPQIMHRVMEIVTDEKSSARDLAREIAHDPALTAKILKIVNSAFYGFYRRIASVDEAVVILGFKEVRSIAITVSVFDMFGRGKSVTEFDRVRLWEHCIAAGTLAEIIRSKCGIRASGAFAGGLLHDIGKVVMDEFFAPEWEAVLDCARQKEISIYEPEREVLDINHTEIGYLVVENWNLPEEISRAIRRHHVEPKPDSESQLQGVVYLANVLVKEKEIGFGGDQVIWPAGEGVRQLLGLEEKHFAQFHTELMKKMFSIRAMLGYFVD